MIMQKRYKEIDLAKGFAIILAVLGHAAPDAVKGFWIAGNDSFSASLHQLIYSFHMPLFFACSGFLLYPKLASGGGNLYKRFKKLMIPYFFLSFAYLGAKMLGGGLADNPLTDNPIVGIFFGTSPCFGAWFLWVLFVMTIIAIILRRINLWILLAIFALLSYIPIEYGDNFFGVEKVHANMMWVITGCLVRKYYESIEGKLHLWTLIISALVLLSIHLTSNLFDGYGNVISHSVTIIKTVSGMLASFAMCYMIEKKAGDSFVYKMLNICGDYCMDIYILSMFVLVPLRIIYVNIGFMNYVPYYVWLVIASVLGVIIPILASKYFVRKVKPLKVLLLGG